MDFMKYNIDFEIFGTIVMIIIIVFFKLKFGGKSESEKSFMRLAYVVTVTQIMDMATAVTISIGGPKMAVFNLIFDTIYFAFELFIGTYFVEYILVSAYKKSFKKHSIVMRIINLVYALILIVNMFFGFYFSFDRTTGDYIHGPLYYVLYLAPGAFTIYAIVLIIYNRKRFTLKQWLPVFSFVLFSVVGLILQGTLIPNMYITFGLVTISFLMILFSLETPDYRKLMQTMDELEEARKEAEESKKEAEKANRVKSDFLANMSHEIRTPINAILGFDEIILRESDNDDITDYASNIKRSGQTLLVIINDILDFSKIESGKMEIIPADYYTKVMISDIVLMIMPRASEKGLSIKCDIDEKIPRKLHGDDMRIRQVLINLLTNAVKYTEKGEVTLGAELVGKDKNAKVRFFVKDTGIGIRKEDQKGLFEAFRRVDEKKNRNIEGTGLGLAICVLTLDLMDSELTLESEYEKGSEFSFVLEQEIVDETPVGRFSVGGYGESTRVEITRESFKAPDAHVLVVDDVKMNLNVFKQLLKNTDMQIDTASGGEQSLEMIRKGNYDIVFMDHLMPEMDGIETLKKGIEEGIIDLKKIPVIALTANAIMGAKEMFLSEGFSDYLSKPIESNKLAEMLVKYLPGEKVIFVDHRAKPDAQNR